MLTIHLNEDEVFELNEEIKKIKKERDTLINCLVTARTKYNNDKARYRKKAKTYRTRCLKAIEKAERLQKTYSYELSDLIFLLKGSDE